MKDEEVVLTVPRQVDAPVVLDITLSANLTGVLVIVGSKPSASNPFGQHKMEMIYSTLDEALGELDHIARLALQPDPSK